LELLNTPLTSLESVLRNYLAKLDGLFGVIQVKVIAGDPGSSPGGQDD